eukprot:s5257_g3.t1
MVAIPRRWVNAILPSEKRQTMRASEQSSSNGIPPDSQLQSFLTIIAQLSLMLQSADAWLEEQCSQSQCSDFGTKAYDSTHCLTSLVQSKDLDDWSDFKMVAGLSCSVEDMSGDESVHYTKFLQWIFARASSSESGHQTDVSSRDVQMELHVSVPGRGHLVELRLRS